jgi:hypothetical protein
VLLVAATGAWQLAKTGRQGQKAALFLALYAAAPLLATWLSAQSRPIFDERYLVASAPPVYLLMAVALNGLWPGAGLRPLPLRLVEISLATVVLGLLLYGMFEYQSNPGLSKTRGWRVLAARLELLTGGMPREAVRLVQNYPDPTLWYYYTGGAPHLVLPPAAHDRAGAGREAAALAEAGVERVILVAQPNAAWDDQAIAAAALAGPFVEVATTEVGIWPLTLFAAQPTVVEDEETTYGNGLRLAGAALDSDIAAPGGVVVAHLAWDPSQAQLQGSEKLSLQLLDDSGRLAAQVDEPLGVDSDGATQYSSYGILLPETMAAGEYALNLVVYDPGAAGAPRLLTTDGRDAVPLASVAVVQLGEPAAVEE